MKPVISITQGVTKMPEWRLEEPVNFSLNEQEHLAIVGNNGAGKSMFIDMVTGRHPVFPQMISYHFKNNKPFVSDNIRYISFRDSYGGENDRTYFLQQRWNQMEIDHETPTAGMILEDSFLMAGNNTPERQAWKEHIYSLFHMEHLLDKYVIQLSSGELRKLKLAEALFHDPSILIMDNPYIGLDEPTRQQLNELLLTLTKDSSLQLMLVLSKDEDIPDFMTHVIKVEDMVVGEKLTREAYLAKNEHLSSPVLCKEKLQALLALPENQSVHPDTVVDMRQIGIRYGERTIIKDFSWTIRNGEKWALTGQNGSGKSTLLSLICADNPQAYACDIALFGKERGSGETIWEIKKHIGYVSPEIHRSYQRDIPSIRIVASGLKDSIGLYVKPEEDDYEKCRWWMNIFGIMHLADRTFLKLSSGEQRLVLLARAFVKDPSLLILDEPMHGLDARNCQMVKEIIDAFCQRKNKTLIMVTHYRQELPYCITNSLYLQTNI